MRKFLLVAIISIISITAYCQDFSNKGKDFWVGYGFHVSMGLNGVNTGGTYQMVLYIATDSATTVTVSCPGNGYTATYSIPANTIFQTATIPKSGTQDCRLFSEGISNKGIHVVATKPVVAYAHIYDQSVSGATVLFPTNTLGKEYYSINFEQRSNANNANCFFYVIACDTGTTSVEITPTAATTGGWIANTTYTVNLTQGQVYNVMGTVSGNNGVDLTGSKIKSIASGTGNCKKIAVFSGAGKLSIKCPNTGAGATSDNYMAQAFPKAAWGKTFLTVPTSKYPNDYYRICVTDPTTVVKVNGVVQAGIINNFYYQVQNTTPNLIEGDKPITVAQYIPSQGQCGGTGNGDPEIIYLSSVEQNISRVILNSTPNYAIGTHYLNIVLPNSGTAISSFRVDGLVPTFPFVVHPQNPAYAYLQDSVSAGQHIVTSDSGFNITAYGYGPAESYGYNGGTNIRDLLTFITPINPLNISTNVAACTGTPFYFSVTLPKHPDSLTYLIFDYHGFFGTHNDTLNAPLTADSTYFIGTTQVWRYKVGHTHSFSPAGVYPITITAGTVTSEGCGNSVIIDRDLYVYDPPALGFKAVNNGCVTDSVAVTDTTSYPAGTYSYKWYWDFGDGNTSTLKSPKHLYTTAGTYTIRYAVVSNVGCLSDTISRTISITNVPIAKFGMSSPVCEGLPVTFSDTSSLVPPGNIIKWYWDFGDGFKVIRINNSDTTHIYAPWNPAIHDTLIVETNTGCKSLPFPKTFKVNPIPVSNFTLPAGVCLPWDSAHFISTSTIADGTGGFGYLWDFGDPPSAPNNSSTLPNPAHHYNNVGPFSIKLTTTSAAGCVHDTTKVLSNIYLQAVAGVTVNPENCLNDVTSFTDNSTGSGNTITEWYWDFGDGSPINTTQNPTHTYATAGIKTVKHWVKTNVSCYSDTATITVTINPLPSPNYTYTAPSCETRVITFTDASVPNAGTLSTWQWNFGDGSPINTTQSPTHTFATAGTYNVKLTVTTSKGCLDTITKAVVINARPLAGFITPEVCLSDTYAQFLDTSKVALPATISAWQWNFGDPNATVANPNTSNLQNPTHSYTAVGPYNIQLIVTSTTGCKDTLNQQLIVNGSFPVANFTVNNSTALCANDSVAIVEASTVFPGSITKVEIYWDNINFPAGPPEIDNVPFTGKVYKHLYLPNSQVTKTYQVRYRAYSGGVCVNDKLATITVNAAPKVQFNAMPDICYDAAPYQITQASEIGGVPGSGVYSGPGVSPTGLFNPVAAGIGTHSIKYTFTSSAAGCVDSIRQNIKVLDTASANFIFVGPVCEGTPATFKELSTAPAGVVLANTTWNFGDGSPLETHAPGSTFVHAFPGWGTYTITMYNTSAYGCKSANKAQQVYISPIPQAAFAFNESSVCLPNALVSFSNNSTIADGSEIQFLYAWDLGDLTASVAKTPPPHLYTSTGPYTVTLKVTSGNNCVNIVKHNIDFIHPQPKADFDFSKPEVCFGDAVLVTDKTDGLDGTVQQWYWDFGDGIKGNTYQVLHQYTSVNTYNVSLYIVNSHNCNSDTVTKLFTVHPYPVVDAGPDRLVLQGGSITIQPAVTGNDLQYLWSPATYLNSTVVESPVASNMQDDITYKLTVTARGGCKKSDDMFVKVLKAPNIPNTFTPNNDGINDTWIIQYLETYPDNRVQVFTRTGQLVFESRGYKTPWNGTMSGKPLPFDTYYYIIEPGNGRAPITGYVTIVK